MSNNKVKDRKFKITDQRGGNGVACKVIPDDEMPVDKNGVVADIVIFDTPFHKRPALVKP